MVHLFPYAANICDYLRATLLCDSFEEMPNYLERLNKMFKILRVKSRIGPQEPGNKVVLINLLIEGSPEITPNKHEWSKWWDGQVLRMVAEIQITIEKMFYLSKQSHSTYEIIRTNSCAEFEYQQGYEYVEEDMFPASPWQSDPLCLL